MSNLGPAFKPPDADPETCRHPPDRAYSWFARDDRAREGVGLVIVCMACNTVIRGAYTDADEQPPSVREQVSAAYGGTPAPRSRKKRK